MGRFGSDGCVEAAERKEDYSGIVDYVSTTVPVMGIMFCGDYVSALVVRPAVYLVELPPACCSQVSPLVVRVSCIPGALVDVVDGKSFSSYEFVPAFIVPALDQKVFSVGPGLHLEIAPVLGDRLQGVFALFHDFAVSDTQVVVVDGVVVRRKLAVVVVVAAVHYGYRPEHSAGVAAAKPVVGVVVVLKAHHVAVLMAQRANGREFEFINHSFFDQAQLGCDQIMVYVDSVKDKVDTGAPEAPLV